VKNKDDVRILAMVVAIANLLAVVVLGGTVYLVVKMILDFMERSM